MVELAGFEDDLERETRRVAVASAREAIEAWVEVTNELLRNAPVGIGGPRSSGDWNLEAIADSVEIEQQGGVFVATWTAETDDGIPLIDIFEFGADPHIIEGNPLVFPDPETGETVFTKKVEHPGIPAVAAVRLGKNRVEMAIERGDLDV